MRSFSSTSTRSPLTIAPRNRIVVTRFIMRPSSENQEGEPLSREPSSPRWMQEASDTMNWLRYAVEHPEDVTAVAIGRMVSKEYGAHERAHTEQHRWRSTAGTSSQPMPPASPGAEARPGASPASGTRAAGWQAWPAGQLGEAGTATSPDLTPHSPPCGPGFLRRQQQQQLQQQQRSGDQQQ